MGVKPQAKAPHSASVAPRGALRRRLRRHITCTARARTQRHQLVAGSLHGSTGTSWPDLGVRAQLLRSARASRRAAKGTRAGRWPSGEMVGSRSVLRRAWRCSAPAGGGATREEQGEAGQIVGRTHESKGVRGLVRASTLEEAAALAFFRVPRIYRRNHVGIPYDGAKVEFCGFGLF